MSVEIIQIPDFASIIANRIKQSRLAVLAGAGISMIHPTNLPSGDELRDLAVKAITSTDELSPYFDLLMGESKYTNLLPEMLFQSLWEHMGNQLGGFFRVLGAANPNEIHGFLLGLCESFGVPIATTNFEHLIEGAGESQQNILHLHGSLGDTASLVIRLNQVGRTIPLLIAKAFLRFVKRKAILIVGYSGRDSDVMRRIDKSEAEEIFWLLFSHSDRAVIAAGSCALRTRCAVGDAQVLVAEFRKRLRVSPRYYNSHLQESTDQEVQRQSILSDWQTQLSTGRRYIAIAAVLMLANNFTAASQLLNKGLNVLRNTQEWEQYLVGAAAIFRLTAHFDEGLDCISKALARAENLQGSLFSRALNVSGLLLLEKTVPEPSLARERFKQAVEQLHNKIGSRDLLAENDLQLLARLHNNLGLASEVLGDYTFAVQAYRESIAIKRSIGDLVGIAQSSANLAIAYYKAKSYRVSRYWRERALSTAETYGLDCLKTYVLRRIGTASCEQGRINWGSRKLREAAESAQKIQGAGFDRHLIEETITRYKATRRDRS
jgi:tetratricopeptide (TPR) repeat protein